MNLVLIRLLCAAVIIVVIAVTYVILQNLREKGVKIFKYGIVRWLISFSVGILLFLLGAKLILTYL